MFFIYLVDLGQTVNAKQEDLRPLTLLLDIHPYAIQVDKNWEQTVLS